MRKSGLLHLSSPVIGVRKPTSKGVTMAVKTSAEECVLCPIGQACSTGAAAPTPCSPGSFQNRSGRPSCESCPAGRYQPASGKTGCVSCTLGHFCSSGESVP